MGDGVFRLKGDKTLWCIVGLLAMISILSVFSSSSFLAKAGGVSKTGILLEQTKSVLFGLAFLFICYLLPLKFYRMFSFIFFGISAILLILLFVKPLQANLNGAVRGLKIGSRTLQVFEIAKIGIILYLARALELWKNSLDTFKDFFLKIALPVFAICLLIVPNSFSSALLVGVVSLLIMVFMDVKWRYIFAMMGIALAAIFFMYGIYAAAFKGHPERMESSVGKIFNRFDTMENRIARFLDNDEKNISEMTDEELAEYRDDRRQEENARYAISEGGLFGKGPGNGTSRYSLSMAFSDFIYAFIVEEYGLLGGIVVMVIYMVFLFRCIRLCSRCKTIFSGALIVGIAFLFVTQAFLHILVNVGLLPVTGHTLPLISHGGTAYLILSGALGIVLCVNKQLDAQDEMAKQRADVENQKLGNYDKDEDNN